MPVTSMTIKIGPPPRPRPKLGDRKTLADGTVMVRRQCYTRQGGEWVGLVQWGRPVAEWVPEGTPHPWEH